MLCIHQPNYFLDNLISSDADKPPIHPLVADAHCIGWKLSSIVGLDAMEVIESLFHAKNPTLIP
jgi:hypothetical protein